MRKGRSLVAVLDSKTYKLIEWHLFHYFDLRRQVVEYEDRRKAISDSSRAQFTGGGHGVSFRSDPTATKTLDLFDLAAEYQESKAETWVMVIEQVIARYEGSPKGKLLELKYFGDMSDDFIQDRLNIERATYFRWRNELVIYTALVAACNGLIEV